MGKKNVREYFDMVFIEFTRTFRQTKWGKTTINFGKYENLTTIFTDSADVPRLRVTFSPEHVGVQAEIDVLDSAGNSVSHLAAIFRE